MAIIMEDMEVLTSNLEDTMEVDQTGTNKEHAQEATLIPDLLIVVDVAQIEIVQGKTSAALTDLVDFLVNILIFIKDWFLCGLKCS